MYGLSGSCCPSMGNWVLEPVERVLVGRPTWRQTATEKRWNLEASSVIVEFPSHKSVLYIRHIGIQRAIGYYTFNIHSI